MSKYCPGNAWYVACWSQELAAGAILSRTILDQPIVLFRTESGAIGALHDRCPHRFAPLSGGKLVADTIQCPYHGLQFSNDGGCAYNPYGPTLKSANVTAYALEERHRAIWIWMGNRQDADPSLLPDFAYLADAPDSAFSAGYLHIEANYGLLIDNIMDLTHVEYLHANSISGNGMVHRIKPTVREDEKGVEVQWTIADIELSPFHAKLHAPITRSDQIARVNWLPPTAMRLKNVIIPLGQAEEDGFADLNAHIVTPETATSTHYFFAASRNYHVEDEQLNAFIAKTRKEVFSTEDEPMIAAVQKRMGDSDFWSLKPVLLGVDEASVRVRRRIASLIAADA